jgi:hypothetical protein
VTFPRLDFVSVFKWVSLVKVKVKVTLQLTVSQSLCHGIEPILGLVTRYYFLSEGCFLKFAVLSFGKGPLICLYPHNVFIVCVVRIVSKGGMRLVLPTISCLSYFPFLKCKRRLMRLPCCLSPYPSTFLSGGLRDKFHVFYLRNVTRRL